MPDKQAGLIEQFVSGCRDYSERLTKDKDEKIHSLQSRIRNLHELLDNRMKTLSNEAKTVGKQNVTIINLNNQLGNLKEDLEHKLAEADYEIKRLREKVLKILSNAGILKSEINQESHELQVSQKQTSELIHENSLLRDKVKTLSNTKERWNEKLGTQQGELYRLRGLLDVLRSEKATFTPEVSLEVKGLNIVNQGLRDKLKACGRKNVILTTANSDLRDASESAEDKRDSFKKKLHDTLTVNHRINATVASLRRERDALKAEIQKKSQESRGPSTSAEVEGLTDMNQRLHKYISKMCREIMSLVAERDANRIELKRIRAAKFEGEESLQNHHRAVDLQTASRLLDIPFELLLMCENLSKRHQAISGNADLMKGYDATPGT